MARDSRVTVLFPTALGELWHVDAKYAQFKRVGSSGMLNEEIPFI